MGKHSEQYTINELREMYSQVESHLSDRPAAAPGVHLEVIANVHRERRWKLADLQDKYVQLALFKPSA